MSSNHHPPKFGIWLIRVFCRADYRDEVLGDLQEVYHWRLANGKKIYARFRYFIDVFSAIRFARFIGVGSGLTNAMLFSFIKSSFRNFRRYPGFTSLNVLGLTLGITAALFILEYVSEEMNYNNSSGSDRIYRVSTDYYRFGNMIYESSMTFSGVGPAMKSDLPEVIEFARLFSPNADRGIAMILTRSDQPDIHYKEPKMFFADQAYLDLFDLHITHGVNELDETSTILLTAEYATKYFGSVEEALGKTLRYDDGSLSFDLRITGIFKKPAFNLQVDTDILISYPTATLSNPDRFINDWGSNSFITFVKLTEKADPKAIENTMDQLTLKYKPAYAEKNEQGHYLRVNRYFLTNITDIHLKSDFQNEVGLIGDAKTVSILQVIALFIVVVAWINFINLSTAKSVNRAREVGVRKVMGARKNELITQFGIEAVLISGMAVVLAPILVVFGQPIFNLFVEKSLSLQSIDIHIFGVLSLVIFVLGTVLSGIYPAVVISSYQAINAMKGKYKTNSGIYLRRSLIVFQLLFSSLLIIATMAIDGQLKFMNLRSLGFDMEEVLIVRGPIIGEASGVENLLNIEHFKRQVLAIPGVSSIGSSSVIPGEGILRGMAISRLRENESDMKSIERVVTSNDFLSTLKVTFLAGKDFEREMEGFEPIILNVSAAKMLGFDDPVDALGQTLYEFTREERKVVGIIADYHHESLNREIDPMYFVRNNTFDRFYAIRLNTNEMGSTLDRIQAEYGLAYPGNPAEQYFLDGFFAGQYKKDEVNRRVFSAFALMAIIVACLGLYGLSSFSALQRTKEVGVRKVLGATIPELFLLLSKEIFILLIIGFILAVPISWWGIEMWLNGFAYRMSIDPILFIFPLAIITMIALMATGGRILKVALFNPVESLRYE